jgi:hypothetical protein
MFDTFGGFMAVPPLSGKGENICQKYAKKLFRYSILVPFQGLKNIKMKKICGAKKFFQS